MKKASGSHDRYPLDEQEDANEACQQGLAMMEDDVGHKCDNELEKSAYSLMRNLMTMSTLNLMKMLMRIIPTIA
jgi:hypothetical protein